MENLIGKIIKYRGRSEPSQINYAKIIEESDDFFSVLDFKLDCNVMINKGQLVEVIEGSDISISIVDNKWLCITFKSGEYDKNIVVKVTEDTDLENIVVDNVITCLNRMCKYYLYNIITQETYEIGLPACKKDMSSVLVTTGDIVLLVDLKLGEVIGRALVYDVDSESENMFISIFEYNENYEIHWCDIGFIIKKPYYELKDGELVGQFKVLKRR